jgi:DMSO/TMAO reductase YedYZ molybdopterin-dependent catalytic subunit
MHLPNANQARRDFLKSTASLSALAALNPRSFAQSATASPSSQSGMIVHETEPENLESPASALDADLTANDRFYVRCHFPIPDLQAQTSSLKIEGAVDRPAQISYSDLLAMPSRTLVSMLECAGNGRVYLVPKADGAQWQNGGMGLAEWTGVPLSAVLARAGIKPAAVDVIFEGADAGEINDAPKSPGKIHFAHSLPVSLAQHGDALLAWKMNGQALSPAHGFPLRLVVPGWYGMASVKWLQRIVVSDKPFDGFFQSLQYSFFDRPGGVPTLHPVTTMDVKSTILQPGPHDVVPQAAPLSCKGPRLGGRARGHQSRSLLRQRPDLGERPPPRFGPPLRLAPLGVRLERSRSRQKDPHGPCHRLRRQHPAHRP